MCPIPTLASSRNNLDHPNAWAPSLKPAFCFGVGLWLWLFCLAAFAGTEVSRTYEYKGFDTNGNLLVEGVITVRVDEDDRVKGDWRLQILDKNKPKELGPQDGSGKIQGLLTGDRIFLNLNPDEYENNIFLDGRVRKSNVFRISGKWGYYGFTGKLNEGNFEMVRRKEPSSKTSYFQAAPLPVKPIFLRPIANHQRPGRIDFCLPESV